MQSLHQQIKLELKKVCSQEEAFAWLMSPQQLLGLRIPARMMAIGEGLAVLEALRSASRADCQCETHVGSRVRTVQTDAR